jgi:hypothetical protein
MVQSMQYTKTRYFVPLLLICEGKDPSLPNLLDQFALDFKYPLTSELLSHVTMVNSFFLLQAETIEKLLLARFIEILLSLQICKSEGVDVTVPQLKHVIDICLGDIRRTVMLLQFWYQGKQQFTGLILCQETFNSIFYGYVCTGLLFTCINLSAI